MNSTNTTNNRTVIVAASLVEAFSIVILNLVVLGLCYKIPLQMKSQLHIYYTFLGAADLLNGFGLFLLTSTFFTEFDIFHYYSVCSFVVTINSAGITTTGYMLLLLTCVKCFSIICPLKSLRLITKNVAVWSSTLTWVLCFVSMILPSILWSRDIIYISNETCSANMVYHKRYKQFIQLGGAVSGIFAAGIILFNVAMVIAIVRRNNKIENDQNIQMRPDVHNCSANDIIKPNTIMAVHSLSHSTISIFVVNNNNEKQVVNSSMPNTSTAEFCHDGGSCNTRTNGYDIRKSKSFKAYMTVLMHVGFYVLCGCPSLVLATDKKLNYYFFNNREIRLFSLLFLYLTSLINPILTLARVPLFVKTIKQIVQKHVRRVTINP